MTRVRAHNISISADGYMAGPDQRLETPLGVGGERLHDWFVATRTFQAMGGQDGGSTGLDDDFAARGVVGAGATLMGRNVFGPVRGPWPDESWRGWWGEEPPYHHPVFVLTHHARSPLEMAGGTTFHFVTGGVEEGLDRAVEAAGGADVRIGGGASTIQQLLRLGRIDHLHVAMAPILLGAGERLWDNLDGGPHGYRCTELAASDAALHLVFERE